MLFFDAGFVTGKDVRAIAEVAIFPPVLCAAG